MASNRDEEIPFSLLKYDKEYYSNKAIKEMSDSKLNSELNIAKKLNNKTYYKKLNKEKKNRNGNGSK